jgi:ribonuclease HI
MKKIFYIDGGCKGNQQLNLSKRKMVAVVVDETGHVLIEKTESGGSNNIAELLAAKEALFWCMSHHVYEVEIRTDSQNNIAWIEGKNVGKKLNDRNAVILLKNTIRACRMHVYVDFKWIPREENLAGHYLEAKYGG